MIQLALWEIMNIFKSREFLILMQALERFQCQCTEARRAGISVPEEAWLQDVISHLVEIETLCADVNLDGAKSKAALVNIYYKRHPNTIDISVVSSDLRNITDVIMSEFWKRKFVQVAEEHNDYIDNEKLLGESVLAAFPSAGDDIREAGNCLAVQCSTGAVFHLMRIAEYGLRALAYDRRVAIPKKLPIDLATWEDIIKQLEKAEDAIRGFPRTIAREAQYDFYHGAMMEFKANCFLAVDSCRVKRIGARH